MKLRNKKTGAIYKIEDIDLENNADGIWIGLTKYNSLAELNEEWEDVPEEPKEFYYINENGGVLQYVPSDPEGEDLSYMKYQNEIGNYFETEEEAEKAVEKLKAWKRLKDKGFVFKGIDERDGSIKTGLTKGVSFNECEEFYDDMNLLFGDEE